MGGLLAMQEYSERSMFNFVLGIKCPWERLLPVFQNRQCFWRTHNLTSNDRHVSLAAVSLPMKMIMLLTLSLLRLLPFWSSKWMKWMNVNGFTYIPGTTILSVTQSITDPLSPNTILRNIFVLHSYRRVQRETVLFPRVYCSSSKSF